MAAPSLQEILIGGFAYFVRGGITVDGQTISATIKPDVDPLSNWSSRSLGIITNFQFGVEEQDDSFMECLPSGVWVKRTRKYVTSDFVDLDCRQMSEIVWQLQHGLTDRPMEDEPQTSGAAFDRKIDGWLRLQGRQLGGYDRFIQDWWCEARLVQGMQANGKAATPKLRFIQHKAVNGVMVAGDSTNFPAAA